MSSTAQGHPRPKPMPKLIAEVREYASELHYALLNRPARKTDARERWDRQFRRVTYEVTQALNRARFPSLPRVAMGAIWVNNVNIVTHTDKGEQVVRLLRGAFDACTYVICSILCSLPSTPTPSFRSTPAISASTLPSIFARRRSATWRPTTTLWSTASFLSTKSGPDGGRITWTVSALYDAFRTVLNVLLYSVRPPSASRTISPSSFPYARPRAPSLSTIRCRTIRQPCG